MQIYFILDTTARAVKVGISDNPRARLSALQTGNPNTLMLVEAFEGDYREEKRLHRDLAPSQIKGEWYRYVQIKDGTIMAKCEQGNYPEGEAVMVVITQRFMKELDSEGQPIY